MRCLLFAIGLWLSSYYAMAQMVRSDSLSQDPGHAQMCATKVKIGSYPVDGKAGLYQISGTVVPFKVSPYLAEQARMNGDALVVLNNGVDAWLVECSFGRLLNQPASVSIIYPATQSGRWSLLTKEELVPPPPPKPDPKIEVARLKYERQHLTRVLKAIDAIQHTPSFAQRARIFCRSQIVAFPLLPEVGSVEDLEAKYEEWRRYEPTTQEEEIKHQRSRPFLPTEAYSNMQICIDGFVNGWQAFPTDEQERSEGVKARTRTAEIDQELAHPRSSSTVLDSVEPKPNPIAMTQGSPAALASQSPAAVALNNRGVALQDKGDLDGAIQDYSEAIRLKPDYAIAFLSRGTARRVKGDLDGAVQDDTEAIRLKPDDAVSFGERGIARRAKGDPDGAIQDFSEAIRLKPNDAKVFVYRGETRLAKGELDGAIQDFNAAISLKPDYADSLSDRGVARQNKGDLDGAIQDYSQAIRLKPDYAIAFDNRGTARQLKGDLDGAIQDFTEAIRLKPDYARAFHDRGATRARKGDAAGAQQDNRRAIQLGWH